MSASSGANASRNKGRGADVIRAVLGILLIFGLLFIADQELAGGRYTRVVEKAAMKIRSTIGL